MTDCLLLQNDFMPLISWFNNNFLSLNTDNCFFMFITIKHVKVTYDYRGGRKSLQKFDLFKDLEVIFDTKLNFSDIINVNDNNFYIQCIFFFFLTCL